MNEPSIRKQKHPRINLAFYADNLDYVREAAYQSRMSVTEYVNRLIEQDREKALASKEPAKIETIVNKDRTKFSPPKNPLAEKWAKLYPPIPKPEYSQVCDGYSCMYCDRCPHGDNWQVPEEDKEIWEQYQKELHAYLKVVGVL